jgi:hypothetical protein
VRGAAGVLAASLLALACSEPARPGSAPAGLKLHLPEGWTARPAAEDVLEVSVQGRKVMSLKVEGEGALPSSAELEAAVVKGGGEPLGTLALPDGMLLHFRVALGAEGVLGVRRLAGHRLLCASEPLAAQSEVKTVASLCTEAEWARPAAH